MENNEQQITIDNACQLIADNLGQTTADQYRAFYKNKDRDTIIISVSELLTEMVGPENARKQMAEKFQSK